MSKKVRLYGCGGCGVNLAAHYATRKAESGCAELLPALIDTSRSNLNGRDLDQVDTFLVDGLDGSGKIRSENQPEIAERIKQILVEVEPTDFNIVVFSASGGSGSVIGPLLLKELNARGLGSVAIVVGGDESVISAENTLKTLQSLELISNRTKRPVIMSYEQNSPNRKRSEVDRDVFTAVSCLSILASGQNQELDGKDIDHWLNYTKVNGAPSQLSTVTITSKPDQVSQLPGILSVASIYSNPDQQHLQTSADYHTDGYADLTHIDVEEIHFAIGVNDVAKVSSDIKGRVGKMLEARDARVSGNSLLDGVNTSGDDDLVV